MRSKERAAKTIYFTGCTHFNREIKQRAENMGMYVTFGPDFHHFNHFKLDVRVHVQAQGALFSRLHLKLAALVLMCRFGGRFGASGIWTTTGCTYDVHLF